MCSDQRKMGGVTGVTTADTSQAGRCQYRLVDFFCLRHLGSMLSKNGRACLWIRRLGGTQFFCLRSLALEISFKPKRRTDGAAGASGHVVSAREETTSGTLDCTGSARSLTVAYPNAPSVVVRGVLPIIGWRIWRWLWPVAGRGAGAVCASFR
jgi:hypothetical protein